MSHETIMIIFCMFFAVVGLVCLYNAYDMKVNGNIKIGWFVGQDIKKEKCKDIPGFIKATYIPVIVFGSTVVISSLIIMFIEAFNGPVVVEFIVFLVLIVLYFWFNRKILKATNNYLK